MHQVMKKLQSLTSLLVLILWLAPLTLVTSGFKDDDVQLTAIANDKGAPANLTFKELKAILQGEKQRWPDGTRISIAFMKTTTPAGSNTAKKVLNMTGDQFNKMWLALVFQGKAKAPTFFNTGAELDAYVNATPGAIGIVEGNETVKSRNVTIDDRKMF